MCRARPSCSPRLSREVVRHFVLTEPDRSQDAVSRPESRPPPLRHVSVWLRQNSICHSQIYGGVLTLFFFSFFSESVGNHKQIVQRLFFPNLMNDLDGIFFKLLITTCAHSQLPLTFLFFRANIDEVETEVVEIEAKLDKVRHLMLPLHMHFICRSIWSCFQRQEMNITLLFSLH